MSLSKGLKIPFLGSSLSAIESARLQEQVSEMEEELDKSKKELSILSAQVMF